MSYDILNFIITVPVESSVLQAVIMVTEIIAVGAALYFVWELVLRLCSSLGSTNIFRRKAGVRGNGHDKARQVPEATYPEEGTGAPASGLDDLATGRTPLMHVSGEKGAATGNLSYGRTE